ncbi:hypothetical protein FHG87_002358 [Trinorchestia longiramus]|nr:hypothetical protein FHG87_002358 [Trinorchestia longiramus]
MRIAVGTEEVNPTRRSLSLTNERSRSGSSAQPTALYNEATTLGEIIPTLHFRSQHLHQELSSTAEINTQPTAEQRKLKSDILSTDRMVSNNIRTNKKCTYSNSIRPVALSTRRAQRRNNN